MATAKKSTAKTTQKKTTQSNSKSSASKKSCCSKTEQAQDACKLSDYDIISDVLGSQKGLIKLYGTALCEVACESLRGIIETKMSECAEDQYDAFLYMNSRGMYKTEPAPLQKVKEARQKYAGSTKNKK